MEKKEIKNMPSSIRTKLKNIAKSNGRDFDAVLLQFFQERFLYRVSLSQCRDNFILKGALLLMVKSISPFRPTKDIDFLGKGIDATPENLKELVKKIVRISCEDGVDFVAETITAEVIKEGADYEGVRLKLEAGLGNIRKIISLDVGFGDLIYGGPDEYDFPVLLNFPVPKIKCYTYESIIAEKFQAIVWLNFQTSRMKDFFDILFLAKVNRFGASGLVQAIATTFTKRHTALSRRDAIFSNEFKNDESKQKQWTAFLRKHHLTEESKFCKILDHLEGFLEPVLGMTLIEIENCIWYPETWQWRSNSTK